MLTVNNLTLTLHHRPLLREIAFSVSPGEVLTLMGPSGSGKSTLFAWMIAALDGLADRVLAADDPKQASLPAVRPAIIPVPQAA